MELLLKRTIFGFTYTHGMLYVDNHYFCDTIEPQDVQLNSQSTYGEIVRIKKSKLKYNKYVAIPTGRYHVTMQYSNHFKRDLPLLNGVPAYVGVFIHAGNSTLGTHGCILVGEQSDFQAFIRRSRKTLNDLVDKIKSAIAKGEKVYITIERS